MEPQPSTSHQAPSPTRSDKSSDSEGKPVREKLKETRIDANAASDHPMKEPSTNGAHADSNSGSDSDRGRLRRKRSREDFEADEDAKHPEKKQERHTRKKSRDVTSPAGSDLESAKPIKPLIASIQEDDHDETVPLTIASGAAQPSSSENNSNGTSPKNKRTREQAEDSATEASKPLDLTSTTDDERTNKRPKDGAKTESKEPAETKTTAKIPPGSGFSNTSAASPFATMSPQKPASKPTDASAKELPQTSDQAFKKSGFGSFASSAASPFGGAASSSGSALGATTGPKLSSFASPVKPATKPSGFASLGGSSSGASAFGGGAANGGKPLFGGALGSSAFGNGSGVSKLSSFGSGGDSITGLTQKPVEFGSKEQPKEDAEEEAPEKESTTEGNDGEDQPTKSRQTLLQSQGPPETGEENEDVTWTGHVKLYTLAGAAGKKAWQERGTGTLKVNVTRESPKKSRFVLRADATHRLLLNVAIAQSLRFGDVQGNEPKDGKVLFTAPTSSGEVESHLLRLKVDKGIDLWRIVEDLKKEST